jgi:hypothetical protein
MMSSHLRGSFWATSFPSPVSVPIRVALWIVWGDGVGGIIVQGIEGGRGGRVSDRSGFLKQNLDLGVLNFRIL